MTWKKGQSGNPRGRPPASEALNDAIRTRIPAEKLAAKLDELVDIGDMKAIQYACDRVAGRPAQAIQLSGAENQPLHMLVGVQARDLSALDAPQQPQDAQEPPNSTDPAQ